MDQFLRAVTVGLSLYACFLPFANGQPPIREQATTDVHGDPLPSGAVARIGTTRLRHGASVTSLAFSSDSKHISSASLWFDSAVFDVSTGRSIVFRSSRQQESLFRATVSSDGSLFAGRTNAGELGVQEAVSGKIIHRFASEEDICDGLVFSRDNRWLASAAERSGNTFIWDLKSGKLAHHFKTKPRDTYDEFCHAFTPDGSIFIQARKADITFWNVQTGKEIRRIDSKEENKWPSSAAVSPDCKLLAVHIAYDHVEFWDIKSGERLRKIAEMWNDVGPAFSPDGKVIAMGGRDGVTLWNVDTGKRVTTMKSSRQTTTASLAFSSDGKLIACGDRNHAIRIWNVSTGKELVPIADAIEGIPTPQLLRDGKTLVVNCKDDRHGLHPVLGEQLSFCDLKGRLLRQSKLPSMSPREDVHVFSPDGNTVAYGTGLGSRLNGDPLFRGDHTSSIRICDIATGKPLVEMSGILCELYYFSFSSNQQFMLLNAVNADRKDAVHYRNQVIQIWKRKSPARFDKVADIPLCYFLSGYCVSADNRWVVVTGKSGYSFHELETGNLLRSYPDARGSIVTLSPSGRAVVSRDNEKDARQGNEVTVWERATGRTICKLESKPYQTSWVPIVVSPDGRFIAGGLDREIIGLWDAFTGQLIGKLVGHRGDIESLCFAEDGRFLISASSDTTVLFWDWKRKLGIAPEGGKLSSERLDELWRDFNADDSQRAYVAMRTLVSSPDQAVDLVRKRKLQKDFRQVNETIGQLIRELDNDNFKARENASLELIKMSDLAEPALRRAAVGAQSPEAMSRVNKVLGQLPSVPLHPSTLISIRLLELLEFINTAEARACIEEFARQDTDPIRKREAEQTLKRLQKS